MIECSMGTVHHGQKVNTIGLNSEDFSTEEEFWEVVTTFIKALTKSGYQCVFRYEDAGVFVIDYDFATDEYGSCQPVWLDSNRHTVIDYTVYAEEAKEDERYDN